MLTFVSVTTSSVPAVAGATVVPRPDHVVIVVEENHSRTNIIGSPNAPYMSSLANENANFTQSFAVTHPSQPNYIALFSGSTQGVTDDSCPHAFSAPSLADELLGAGQSFASYSETLPSTGFTGCTSGEYSARHNPWVNFPSVPASTNQPFTSFPTDYSTLPAVSFVVPNLVDDMHDGSVAQGDAWLQANLGGYVTWAKQHNSLFILSFDEDDNRNGNNIPTIMAGQRVTPGSYSETINHYSVLRTVEDAFGLASLGASGSTAPILDIWSPEGTDQAPVADFTSACTGLSCTFDGSTSSDPDGTVAGYSWDFGDGQTATGATVSHVFASGGTYRVTLTVADNAGATTPVSRQVSTVGPATVPFVSDTFARTVTGGWGSADVGGPWTATGTASGFAVAPGAGSLQLARGAQLSAALPSAISRDTDLRLSITSNKASTGAGVTTTVTGRRVSTNNEYRARLRITAANKVTISLTRLVAGTETAMAPEQVVPDITFTPGLVFSVRMQVVGTNPTTVRARAWPVTEAEPTNWLESTSDSTAALQSQGTLAVTGSLSSSSTNAPVSVSVSHLSAVHTLAPAPNLPPTAAFTTSCTYLACTYSGAGSIDPDGTIASYAWTFGDGQTATGATPLHSYATAGMYDVALTVTDDRAASNTTSQQVTVTAPPVTQTFASDQFGRSVLNGWGSADLGGPWTLTGSAAAFSVSPGSAAMVLAKGSQLTGTLGSVSSNNTDLTLGVSADKVPTGSGAYLVASGRRVSPGNEYRARLRITSAKAVSLYVSRLSGGTETALTTERTITGLTYSPGLALSVRLQVTGTSPTTVRARVWPTSGTEPTTWLATATDSTPGLQVPGAVGLMATLSSTSTNAPVVVRFNSLGATHTTG